MSVYVMMHAVLDESIVRSAATGPRYRNATYQTPRCSQSWLRRFARRVSYDARTVESQLRERGFDAMYCAACLEPHCTAAEHRLR